MARFEGDIRSWNFRLHEQLGRGGMGSVWRATDTEVGRPTAIKVLDAQGPRFTEAFERELDVVAPVGVERSTERCRPDVHPVDGHRRSGRIARDVDVAVLPREGDRGRIERSIREDVDPAAVRDVSVLANLDAVFAFADVDRQRRAPDGRTVEQHLRAVRR